MNKALFRLMAGFRRFREKYFQENQSFYKKLATSGQTPKTLMIGCSDSRVDPAIITDAAPGELFVIRNVANLVPPCENKGGSLHGTSSAIEFAVTTLKVENIVVLGHRQCGGIRALMDGSASTAHHFVGNWMSIAKDARDRVLEKYKNADEDTLWRQGELESIKVSLKNLMTFPFIKEAVDAGRLNVVGTYFDLERGQMFEYVEASDDFQLLEI